MGNQLDKADGMGRLEYTQPGLGVPALVHNPLPLGARAKPNGSVRMLVDPHSLV